MSRVLVVDDVPEILSLWRKALAQDGHVVFRAEGVDDAKRVLMAEDLDILVTDLVIPDRNGLELIAFARSIRPTLKILAVYGGGAQSDPTLSQAKAAGADATLAKPFRLNDLRRAVSTLRSK